MTKLMQDILRQPDELSRTLAYGFGPGERAMAKAASLVGDAACVFITGIGSSWHAGMAVHSFFNSAGYPACLMDASELLYFSPIPRGAALVILSRSGKSIEVVNLLNKAKQSRAKIIAITNAADSPLARAADVVLNPEASFDHIVSVTMYSALALVGGLLASRILNIVTLDLRESLAKSLAALRESIPAWLSSMRLSDWFQPDAPTYFLARGGSLASCHSAKLLWEEAAKAPATAMTTGGFRHGSQEMIVEGVNFGLWIDAKQMRDQDLAVADDIRTLGGKVMVIGQGIPKDSGDLVLQLPKIPKDWQFLVDVIPAQLAAEHLSRLRGVDCDSFRVCSYIVEDEDGLVGQRA